jgi:hypothetical protein
MFSSMRSCLPACVHDYHHSEITTSTCANLPAFVHYFRMPTCKQVYMCTCLLACIHAYMPTSNRTCVPACVNYYQHIHDSYHMYIPIRMRTRLPTRLRAYQYTNSPTNIRTYFPAYIHACQRAYCYVPPSKDRKRVVWIAHGSFR